MIASFQNNDEAIKFGLTTKDVGIVLANETRDGEAFLTIQFDTVEVNGLPSKMFDVFEDAPEDKD